MTVRCSLAYERRSSVASTETALEPTSLTMVMQGRRKHLRVGQAQSRRAQFINIHCITSFYELSTSVDEQ